MNKENYKSRFIYGKVIAIICIIFSLNFVNVQATQNEVIEEITLTQVRNSIGNYYYENVSEDIINLNSPQEIVEAIDDPYTEYFSKQEFGDFINSIEMKIYGIGIYAEKTDAGILVKSVIDYSPAAEVGIKAGDIIVMADNKILFGLELDDAINYIKGPEGTKVKITVKREQEYLDFDVTRREIKLPTVEGQVIDDHIGYIALYSFALDTEEHFNNLLKEFEQEQVNSYIIDLRNNGGGYMYTARQIAGHFISDNTCLIVKDKTGVEEELKAIKNELVIDKPVIFLINQYSASASEILSAALKDYDKAYFVGETTYGKGVAQLIFELYDGSALKLTNEEFFSPKGNKINNVGVEPDLVMNQSNSLDSARILLSSKEQNITEEQFIKINDDEWNFKLNKQFIKDNGLQNTYINLINNIPKQASIYQNINNDWEKINSEYLSIENNTIQKLYDSHSKFKELENIPIDKEFTIVFSKEVDINNFEQDTVELIDAFSGKNLEFQIKQLNENSITVKPINNLEENKKYYLIVNEGKKSYAIVNTK